MIFSSLVIINLLFLVLVFLSILVPHLFGMMVLNYGAVNKSWLLLLLLFRFSHSSNETAMEARLEDLIQHHLQTLTCNYNRPNVNVNVNNNVMLNVN